MNVSNVQSVDLIGPDGETLDAPVVEAPIVTEVAEPVAATAPEKAKTYGPITTYETLWSVSTKLRPNNNVSVFQTLVAIYKTNPNAFLNGDINKIISRSIIEIPSDEFIAQQTNAEATRLLNPQVKPIVSKKVETIPTVTEQVVETATEPEETPADTKSVAQEIIEDAIQTEVIEEDKEVVEQQAEETQINEQESELADLNEQLIVLTEANQRLKIKLQPLSDQITILSEQLDEDAKIQKELQDIIDQYRAQIDAFVEPPFSGEGYLNSILRAISSSATVLISTILFPILLLIAAFLFILRLKSKRELEENEKELAESTDISNEDSDEFDTLLTDEIGVLDNQDSAEKQPEENKQEETAEQETDTNATLNESELAALESEDLIDASATEPEVETLQEDLVDLEALSNQPEEIIELSEIDLDAEAEQKDLELAAEWESQLADAEPEVTTEEAPQKVTAVDPLEDMEEAFAVLDGGAIEKDDQTSEPVKEDASNTETSEEDELLEIADTAIPEEDELVDIDDTNIEDAESSELVADALAEVEDKTTAVEDELVEVADTATAEEEELLEIADTATADEEELLEIADTETAEEEILEIAGTATADEEELLEIADTETAEEELLEIADTATADEEELLEIADTETAEEDELLEIADTATPEEDVLEIFDTASIEEDEIDISADAETESLEDLLKQATDIAEEEYKESLAEQLSSGAFNEDVELPSIEDHEQDSYIDIDTLLSSTDNVDVAEEEFDLEFGLDEFPDVIDSIADFDTDADGVAAQLDLARAYLEIDEKESAKDILTKLLDSAENDKLKEVQKLLNRIS